MRLVMAALTLQAQGPGRGMEDAGGALLLQQQRAAWAAAAAPRFQARVVAVLPRMLVPLPAAVAACWDPVTVVVNGATQGGSGSGAVVRWLPQAGLLGQTAGAGEGVGDAEDQALQLRPRSSSDSVALQQPVRLRMLRWAAPAAAALRAALRLCGHMGGAFDSVALRLQHAAAATVATTTLRLSLVRHLHPAVRDEWLHAAEGAVLGWAASQRSAGALFDVDDGRSPEAMAAEAAYAARVVAIRADAEAQAAQVARRTASGGSLRRGSAGSIASGASGGGLGWLAAAAGPAKSALDGSEDGGISASAASSAGGRSVAGSQAASAAASARQAASSAAAVRAAREDAVEVLRHLFRSRGAYGGQQAGASTATTLAAPCAMVSTLDGGEIALPAVPLDPASAAAASRAAAAVRAHASTLPAEAMAALEASAALGLTSVNPAAAAVAGDHLLLAELLPPPHPRDGVNGAATQAAPGATAEGAVGANSSSAGLAISSSLSLRHVASRQLAAALEHSRADALGRLAAPLIRKPLKSKNAVLVASPPRKAASLQDSPQRPPQHLEPQSATTTGGGVLASGEDLETKEAKEEEAVTDLAALTQPLDGEALGGAAAAITSKWDSQAAAAAAVAEDSIRSLFAPATDASAPAAATVGEPVAAPQPEAPGSAPATAAGGALRGLRSALTASSAVLAPAVAAAEAAASAMVPVEVEDVAGGLALGPRSLRFGTVAVGGTYSLVLTLSNRGDGLLRYRFGRGQSGPHEPRGNSVRIVLGPGGPGGPLARALSRTIVVELVAREPGPVAASLDVVTPAAAVRVPVSAFIVPAPAMPDF